MTVIAHPGPASAPTRLTIIRGVIATLAWLIFSLWVGSNLVFAKIEAAGLAAPAFMLWFAATFALRQNLKFVRLFYPPPKVARLRRVIEFTICLVIGYLLTAWTVEAMLARHDQIIMEHFTPLVRALVAGQDVQPFIDPDFTRTLTVWRGENGYLLSVQGASLDSDGSTVFYDSETGHLLRFHNDLQTHPNARHFTRRTDELVQVYPVP